MILLLAIFLTGLAAFPAGIYAGTKLRGHIPLRMPSNSVRIGDAKSDVEIARARLERQKVEREIEQEQMELDADRIKGHAAIAQLQSTLGAETLQLEAAKDKPEIVPADAIRTRRAELGLTQKHVAEYADISLKRLADVEAGNGGTDAELRKLAYELDLEYVPARVLRPERNPVAVLPHQARARNSGDSRTRDALRAVGQNSFGSITCPVCSKTSHHPADMLLGWCGNCEQFTGKTEEEIRKAIVALEQKGEPDVAKTAAYRLGRLGVIGAKGAAA